MTTASSFTLAAALDADAEMPASWAAAFGAVPRERFIPDRMWVDEGEGDDVECVPLDRAVDPKRWLSAVYSNKVVVTQFDDGATVWPAVGYRPTSSASMPSAVLGMLDALNVDDGHRVLEIGTGTGYNAALLAERLGDAQVVTVEIDPVVADQARRALIEAGHEPTVICGDGALGYPQGAPYDRILATASIRFGQFPYAWVAQTRPGGIIVTPVRADLTYGPLVAFTVGADGTATGRVLPMRVGFMELRSHRMPSRWSRLRWDDPAAELTHTEVQPWPVLLAEASQWAIALAVPQCKYDVWEKTADRPHGVAWLVDTCSGSWASVVPGAAERRYDVRQYGPRRLWNEAEAAYRWWRDQGSPALERWRFTVTPDRQSAEPAIGW